jgi:hypothetical protein
MDFPAFVYKDDGPHERAGGTFDMKLVSDEKECAAMVKEGWYVSMLDAINPVKTPAPAKVVPKIVSKA